MVTMVKVKMRKGNVKNRHYNINILFIYSEQMTESDIDFDQNDHDHFDQTAMHSLIQGLVPVSLSLEIPKKNKFSLGYLLAYSYLCSGLRKKS